MNSGWTQGRVRVHGPKSYRVAVSGGHMREAPGGPSPTGHSSEQLAEMSELTAFQAKSKTFDTKRRYSRGAL
jgi:hypothetical protein